MKDGDTMDLSDEALTLIACRWQAGTFGQWAMLETLCRVRDAATSAAREEREKEHKSLRTTRRSESSSTLCAACRAECNTVGKKGRKRKERVP